VISLLTALWSASGGTAGMMQALNLAYDETETRKFLKLRGTALALTVGGIVVALIAVGLVAVLPAVLDSLGLGSVGRLLVNILRWPLVALVFAAALAVLYRYAPDRDQPKFSWVSVGAGVATLLWLIASGLFSFYISNFGEGYGRTYGAIAGVIILLLWLYLSAFIILFGGSSTRSWSVRRRLTPPAVPTHPWGSATPRRRTLSARQPPRTARAAAEVLKASPAAVDGPAPVSHGDGSARPRIDG
jgi:membrane protein